MGNYEVKLEIKRYETFIVKADNCESAEPEAIQETIARGYDPKDIISVIDIDSQIENLRRSKEIQGETL